MSAGSPSRRQRLFARFLAAQDDVVFEMYRDKKEKLLSDLQGTIVELGPGTGVNLQFLQQNIQWIGIDPNQAMHPHLKKKAAELGLDVQLHATTLGEADIGPGSVDAVISTLVLCSVPSVSTVLRQIHQVLKPGGRFVFIEHVVDRPWTLRRMVQKAAPYTPWRYFSDGCNPGRDIAADIRAAGFSEVQCQSYVQHGPPLILAVSKPHIFGAAVK